MPPLSLPSQLWGLFCLFGGRLGGPAATAASPIYILLGVTLSPHAFSLLPSSLCRSLFSLIFLLCVGEHLCCRTRFPHLFGRRLSSLPLMAAHTASPHLLPAHLFHTATYASLYTHYLLSHVDCGALFLSLLGGTITTPGSSASLLLSPLFLSPFLYSSMPHLFYTLW